MNRGLSDRTWQSSETHKGESRVEFEDAVTQNN